MKTNNPFDRLPSRRDSLIDFRNAIIAGCFITHEVVMPANKLVYAAEITPEENWGTIRGQIVYDQKAKLPEIREVDFSKINLTAQEREFFTAKGKVYYEDFVINPTSRGVQHVFVWLRPDSNDTKINEISEIHPSLRKVLTPKIVMDQEWMGFRPHAIAARATQSLSIKNSSPITHAVVWNSRDNGTGNRSMPANTELEIENLKAERLPIQFSCAPHPWERAVMRVFDHPYFALTDDNGRFELKLAPAGKYRLVVWQESIGFRDGAKGRLGVPIEIEPGKMLDLGKLSIVTDN